MAKRTYGGGGDQVTRVTFTRTVKRYGFTAYLIDEGDCGAVFLAACSWQGQQPLLAIHRFDAGHADWVALLMAEPAIEGELKFVGAGQGVRPAAEQWITHGPSPLIGDGICNFEIVMAFA